MTRPAHTAAHRVALDIDIAIGCRAAHIAAAAAAQQHGRAARTARAWIENMHAKAQIRAERHAKPVAQ